MKWKSDNSAFSLFFYFLTFTSNIKKMKQVIYYIILISFILALGCSSKQEKNTSASVKTTGNSTDSKKMGSIVKDKITISTPDRVNLSADYYYGSGNKETPQPLIILIHQFTLNKDQWDENFIDSLAENGYKILAYDIRGHGESDKVNYKLTDLLSDQDKAPKDIDGIFNWMVKQKGIDSTRIGIMGTSIGGNLGIYAKYNYGGVKAVVDVSGSADGYEKLSGIDPRMMSRPLPRLFNIFFICGNKDGNSEKDAKYLMDNYIMNPMELKVYDSDKHGIFLIREYPEIYSLALNWFKKYL